MEFKFHCEYSVMKVVPNRTRNNTKNKCKINKNECRVRQGKNDAVWL